MAANRSGISADTNGVMWRLQFSDWHWTHFDLAHVRVADGLAAEGWMPGDAVDLLREEDDSPRLESIGNVAMGVMPDFTDDAGQEGQLVASWSFVMRADRILTGQRSQTRGLAAVWKTCHAGNPPDSPAELVEQVLAAFAAEAARRAVALDAAATEIEDELLEKQRGSGLGDLRARLARVRREAARLQRAVVPVERLTREDMLDLPGWGASAVHETARRRILSAVDDLRAFAEHGRALQEELGARQAEATTRYLSALSVLSAVLLPPTLVTGFFGMNTESLPFKDVENGTWAAGAVAFCAGALTLLLLRVGRGG